MQLNSKQLELQEAMLKRLYPGVSMEEIKFKELGFGCSVMGYNMIISYCVESTNWRDSNSRVLMDGTHKTTEYLINNNLIDGKPITLPRILTALGDEYIYRESNIMKMDNCRSSEEYVERGIGICFRKLLNEDMTDCNLRQQSQETQDILYSIFCKKGQHLLY